MPSDLHMEICSRLMVPGSERLARIFEMLCDEKDAVLVLALPGTAEESAVKVGMPVDEAKRRLDLMFFKGVVFDREKPEGRQFLAPRHLIQFHDASVQWPDAPREFFALWKEFMAEEYPNLLKMILSAGFPAFMRVVPALGALENMPDVQPREDVSAMIEQAKELALCRCPCRLTEQDCRTDVEVCMQIDRGAQYNLQRGTGRRISKQEAMEILRKSEKDGLVHCVDIRDTTSFICNCCDCCCAILKPHMEGGVLEKILERSPFRARVVADLCEQDEFCMDICPVGAISMDGADGSALVDEERCIGCGLCVTVCPFGAMSLKTPPA